MDTVIEEKEENQSNQAEMQKKEHIEKAYVSVFKKKLEYVLNKYNQTWSLRLVLSSYIYSYLHLKTQ